MNVTIHGSASIIEPNAIYHKRPFRPVYQTPYILVKHRQTGFSILDIY
jgi:hypothetical protein